MKKKLLLVCMALLSLFSASATVVPTTSTLGNDVWYRIKCSARNTPTAVWLTGSTNGGNLTISDLSTTDESQLWKAVASANGYALVNKQFGTYMNTDLPNASHITAIDVAPTLALQLVPSVTLPGGVVINDANTVLNPVTNVPATAQVFTFYAAGSGYSFHPANLNGYNPILVHSSVIFMTTKELLNATITSATTMLNNSAGGYSPGQKSQDDIDALSYAIEATKAIYDNPASTEAEILAASGDLDAVISIIKSRINLPLLSASEDNWYYIQGTRPANTYMTGAPAGTGTQIKDLPVIPDDTQLWRLVPNGDGFAMQNKASQEYLITDLPSGSNLSTQAIMPIKALRFIPSTETTNKVVRFWIENTTSSTEALRLHAGGVANGWGIMNWTGNANDNCTWMFISYDDLFRNNLIITLESARSLYDNAVEGTEFGQFSIASLTAMNDMLTVEEAKNIGTMTQAELIASTASVKAAISAFVCNGDPTTFGSVTTYKWFRLINASKPLMVDPSGKAMSSNGRVLDGVGNAGKYTYETKDINSDAQLFRFEMNADGTKVSTFVNKATGLYMGFDGTIVSTPTADNEFTINRLDGNSFSIKPTAASPLFAGGGTVSNWNSGIDSPAAWTFEYVKSENIDDFTVMYTTTKAQTRVKYDALALLKGDEIGQYPTTVVDALGAILTAEEAKDVATLTQAEMLQAILDMKAAVGVLVVNTDIKLLTSTTPNALKWFRLINGASSSVAYVSGFAMSSNGRMAKEPFSYEVKDINSDAQLFSFELNTNQTKVATMFNKGAQMYMSPTGAIINKDSIMQITNEFEITQLGNGGSFWIHPTYIDATDPAAPYRVAPLHAQEIGSEIMNYSAGVGSASAWVFEFVKEESTALKSVEAFTYTVRTTNNIITVDGVENFEVYSVLGQKQNVKRTLNRGVYVVKVNNKTQKVVLK